MTCNGYDKVLDLDDGAFEAAGDPGEGGEEPLFADDTEFADDGVEGARAVFEDPGLDEGTWDEDSEEIVVEEIRYVETIEVETQTIEIGTPVLVVDGYSSWGYGAYPVVRSSRRFDPCFTPPGGACWAPVDFDPSRTLDPVEHDNEEDIDAIF